MELSRTKNTTRNIIFGICYKFVATLGPLKFERVFQLDHSYSAESGIIRGPNYQKRPFNQAKIVRVVKGAVYSVGIDIDPNSTNYGYSVGYILSA